MLAEQWLSSARAVLARVEETQKESVRRAAAAMADAIGAGRWVHTFGCGHATLPVEEIYPRIGSFVGFHPMIELPLSFFTHITGEMGVPQFVFLERVEGYGRQIMKAYDFDRRDVLWLFSHSGLNQVNVDVALRAKELGLTLVVTGSAAAFAEAKPRHSSGKKVFDLADVLIDTCVPAGDAVVPVAGHVDKVGPLSTMAFVAVAWMTVTTVAEILAARGVKLFVNPSHNAPGDTGAGARLEEALREYKRRIAGV
jgi:uncharacterized phosphosugar-binding protein